MGVQNMQPIKTITPIIQLFKYSALLYAKYIERTKSINMRIIQNIVDSLTLQSYE